MTKEELYKYMKHPQSLSKETVEELRLLVETYPYSATFVFLYLYNLALINDLRYPSELKKYAHILPDRAFLYQLIEKATDSNQWDWAKEKDPNDKFSLVDKFLEENEESLSSNELAIHSSISEDYFAAIGEDGENSASIEQDIKEFKDLSPINIEQSDDTNDAMLSETLARIYIEQKKYDKALRIIRNISLNYPKKNIYFADQIRFLERIIEYNKNN